MWRLLVCLCVAPLVGCSCVVDIENAAIDKIELQFKLDGKVVSAASGLRLDRAYDMAVVVHTKDNKTIENPKFEQFDLQMTGLTLGTGPYSSKALPVWTTADSYLMRKQSFQVKISVKKNSFAGQTLSFPVDWASYDRAVFLGEAGINGTNEGNAENGLNGPNLSVYVAKLKMKSDGKEVTSYLFKVVAGDKTSYLVATNAPFEVVSKGGPGGNGREGGAGEVGSNNPDGPGSSGQDGEPGGDGANGANGGNVTLYFYDNLDSQITASSLGGDGGKPGPGGPGGRGGSGKDGANGEDGADGAAGNEGQAGSAGNADKKKITKEEMIKEFQSLIDKKEINAADFL